MYKFALFIALLFAFAFGGCGNSSGGPGGGGGDGGDGDSIIRTVEDLKNINADGCAGTYSLGNDIAVNEEWQGLCPEGLTGSFDGGGFTITFEEKINGGVFAYIDDGKVENLNIAAHSGVAGIEIMGYNYAGALVSYADENSVIENCSADVAGDVIAEGDGAFAGGLVGNSLGNISDSYVTVSGNVAAVANNGNAQAGGLAGNVEEWIDNAFAYVGGQITADAAGVLPGRGNSAAGGLTGSGEMISNSFAIVNHGVMAQGDNVSVAGGISGQATSLESSFAVISGFIDAVGFGIGYAGGAVGSLYDPETPVSITNCVMIIGESLDASGSAGNVAGQALEFPDPSDNYIYAAFTIYDGQATEIYADDVKAAAWWMNDGPDFSDADWCLEDGAIPMQTVFPDLALYTWPAWVQ